MLYRSSGLAELGGLVTDHGQQPQRGVAFGWLARVADRVPGGSIARVGLDAAGRIVDQVPALAWARSRIDEVEREALQALRDRLAQLDGAVPGGGLSVGPLTPATRASSAADEFAALLRAAEDQSAADARASALLRIIRELVPDEARIIRTLADGSEYAVIQAYDGSDHIVVNHSSVGRQAKVHSQDLTPSYVSHLLEMGLVELVPYTGSNLMEYELLESETPVRKVLSPYDHRKLMKPRIVRQVVRLSAKGADFCAVCLPE